MRDYFIYVGRLDELKGIKILFKAWKQMKPHAPWLIVCGKGPLDGWCHSFIKDVPDLNIEMLGFVSNVKAKELIINAKALILPTQWYEGFPMAILEAYSVGTPVIGSDMGNVGDLIEEGVTGWKFKFDSVEGLIQTVQTANRNTIDSEQIKAIFDEKYSARKNIQMLERIYHGMMGESA